MSSFRMIDKVPSYATGFTSVAYNVVFQFIVEDRGEPGNYFRSGPHPDQQGERQIEIYPRSNQRHSRLRGNDGQLFSAARLRTE